MTDLSELRFFQTRQHACGYLDNKSASNIVVDPAQEIDAGTYSVLSSLGFRRSGSHVYRPRCENCSACTPIRVLADDFRPTKSQKRCLKKNKDLKVCSVTNIDTDEYYGLYHRYINARHADGEMYPPSRSQFRDFLAPKPGVTRYLIFRAPDDNVVSVAVVDILADGLSAMYSFFEPKLAQRSLGKFNILYQILHAQALKLPYLYLGYWIQDCQKMSYKTDYLPNQLYRSNQWISSDS